MKYYRLLLLLLLPVSFLLFAFSAVHLPSYKQKMEKTIENEGFKYGGFADIKVGDVAFAGCSRGEYAGRYFSARRSDGKSVDGLVCCNLAKTCAIRW